MKERRLNLSPSCSIVHTEYGNDVSDVGIEYTEHSPDPWYGNTESCIEIDEEKAKEIIDFLANAFNL